MQLLASLFPHVFAQGDVMTTLIVLFNLKDADSHVDYERWARVVLAVLC